MRASGVRKIDARITEIEAVLERLALLKGVEGRAGKCQG